MATPATDRDNDMAAALAELDGPSNPDEVNLYRIQYAVIESYRVYRGGEYMGVIGRHKAGSDRWWAAKSYLANEEARTYADSRVEALAALGAKVTRASKPRKEGAMNERSKTPEFTPGARLVATHKGEKHSGIVTDDGFKLECHKGHPGGPGDQGKGVYSTPGRAGKAIAGYAVTVASFWASDAAPAAEPEPVEPEPQAEPAKPKRRNSNAARDRKRAEAKAAASAAA